MPAAVVVYMPYIRPARPAGKAARPAVPLPRRDVYGSIYAPITQQPCYVNRGRNAPTLPRCPAAVPYIRQKCIICVNRVM